MPKTAALLTALASLLVASVAQAASLTITPDQPFYDVGDTITLTIVGDSMGAEDLYVFGALLFDPTILTPVSATQNQLTSFDGAYVWSEGAIGTQPAGPGSFTTFNQVGALAPYAVDQQLVATVTFTLDAYGTTDIDWLEDGSTNTLHFFGLTSAPGITIVPEPGTAALLSLGLLGLAVGRGRAVPR